MKVSSPEIQGRGIRNLLPGNRPGARNTLPGAVEFATLLKNAALESAGGEAPTDAKWLAARLEVIRSQMNEAILQAFAEEEGDLSTAEPAFAIPMADVGRRPAVETGNGYHPATCRSPVKNESLDAVIDKASATYGVDRDLIVAVIRAESGFDTEATSPKKAMGLMQLMPETARELGVTNAYDPEQNVMAGTRYLKGLLDRYGGDVKMALAAYNWGMGNLENSEGGLPKETRNYVARILKDYGSDNA
ncbi:MAG: lytic transglycosylase domain-containing protein [Thermodesulfobacteriota bacterium]